jgi:hypothetical protein
VKFENIDLSTTLLAHDAQQLILITRHRFVIA